MGKGYHGAINLIGEKNMAILIPEQFTGIKNENKSAGFRIPALRNFTIGTGKCPLFSPNDL